MRFSIGCGGMRQGGMLYRGKWADSTCCVCVGGCRGQLTILQKSDWSLEAFRHCPYLQPDNVLRVLTAANPRDASTEGCFSYVSPRLERVDVWAGQEPSSLSMPPPPLPSCLCLSRPFSCLYPAVSMVYLVCAAAVQVLGPACALHPGAILRRQPARGRLPARRAHTATRRRRLLRGYAPDKPPPHRPLLHTHPPNPDSTCSALWCRSAGPIRRACGAL